MRRGKACCPFENPIWNAITLMDDSRSEFSVVSHIEKHFTKPNEKLRLSQRVRFVRAQ